MNENRHWIGIPVVNDCCWIVDRNFLFEHKWAMFDWSKLRLLLMKALVVVAEVEMEGQAAVVYYSVPMVAVLVRQESEKIEIVMHRMRPQLRLQPPVIGHLNLNYRLMNSLMDWMNCCCYCPYSWALAADYYHLNRLNLMHHCPN